MDQKSITLFPLYISYCLNFDECATTFPSSYPFPTCPTCGKATISYSMEKNPSWAKSNNDNPNQENLISLIRDRDK